MNKLLLVIQREYLSRVRKKSFIIMTLLTPFLLVGLFVIPSVVAVNSETNYDVAIVDENKFEQLKLKSTETLRFQTLNNIDFNDNKTILLDTYDFLLHVPKVDSLVRIESQMAIYSKNQISLSNKSSIESKLEKILTNYNLIKNGIDPEQIKLAESNISIDTYVVDTSGKDAKSSSEASYGIGMICGFLIYIFIFSYGTMVMRSVVEEKTNRIVEIIISSIKPFQLMLGKIMSIALVGLTQFFLWIVLAFLLLIAVNGFIGAVDSNTVSNDELQLFDELISSVSNLPIRTLVISFILYFVGGYLLYGSLFAAIGSASDQETDSQQFILPITIPLILSFVFIQLIVDSPHSGLAYTLSMIPFTSPIIMMARIPFGVGIHEIILSVSLLILGFITTSWIAAKIYRVGILMYGKKITYNELWKWLKYKG